MLRLALLCCAILGSIASLLVALLAILQSPIPFACAVCAGALAASTNQWLRLRTLRTTRKPLPFAAFRFEEGAIRCTLQEDQARRYVTRLRWKIVVVLAAGMACWAAQQLAFHHLNLLSIIEPDLLHRLGPLLTAAEWGLPMIACALAILVDGPVKRWVRQMRSTLEHRAEKICAEALRDREIDGLDRAIHQIHEQLGRRRSSTYRGAIEKNLRARTESVVFNPYSMSALIDALTEAARLELRELSEGLERYRSLRSEIKALQSAASILQEPLIEAKAEDAISELNQITELVVRWGWSDFHKQLLAFDRAVEEMGRKLRDRRMTAPAVVLTPGSTPYSILGIDSSAPTSSIRKLRLRLAQVYHPDIGGETCNASKMAEVNAAYDAIMSDRDAR